MFGDDFPVRRSPREASWQEPFHWWGPPWQQPEAKSLAQLVALGMLSESQAAWLVDHLTSGGSIVVAANPQGAGKSTLSHALIAELPVKRRKVYLRGMYEPFDWVDASVPAATSVLVNEISPHLPIYAWGDTVRRLLELGQDGFQIIATIHADSIEEVVAQLAAYPIHATAAQLASFDVVVFLTVTVVDDTVDRHVGSIVTLTLDGGGGMIVTPFTE